MDELIEHLRRVINDGDYPKSKATKRLQEWREKTLAGKQPKLASVCILFYPHKGEPHVALMKRPEYQGTHGGQISFPGGKIEESDPSPKFAALRELEEEFGIKPNTVEVIAKLPDLYIPPSNFLVHPFVGHTEKRPTFIPDPLEVARIIEVPLSEFLEPSNLKEQFFPADKGKIVMPYFDLQGETVWGATALMLLEIRDVLMSA